MTYRLGKNAMFKPGSKNPIYEVSDDEKDKEAEPLSRRR